MLDVIYFGVQDLVYLLMTECMISMGLNYFRFHIVKNNYKQIIIGILGSYNKINKILCEKKWKGKLVLEKQTNFNLRPKGN